jgi:phospholipase/lecithinase/hemolysin
MTDYYATQHELYQAGARNFLFVNVPPVHRSPAWRNGDSPPVTILTWNQKLREVAEYFQSNHSDATVMLFSSWDCFTTILDEPTRHGFSKSDPGTAGGGIWVDRLHPTSRMHDYIARDISQFLEAQPAGGG